MTRLGDKTICLSCCKPITATIERNNIIWQHDEGNPRHIATPQAYASEDIAKIELYVSQLQKTQKTVKEWVLFVEHNCAILGIPFNYEVVIGAYSPNLDSKIIKQMLYGSRGFSLDTFEAEYGEMLVQKQIFDPASFIRNLPAPKLMDTIVTYFIRVTDGLIDGQNRLVKKGTLQFFLEQRHHIFPCEFSNKMFTVAYSLTVGGDGKSLQDLAETYDILTNLYLIYIKNHKNSLTDM